MDHRESAFDGKDTPWTAKKNPKWTRADILARIKKISHGPEDISKRLKIS